MTQTSTQERHLECVRCGYEWMPRKDQLPKRCPSCRSVKWNDSNLRVTCLRCNHIWNSHDGSPTRCPKCGSHQWNVPPMIFTCKRCKKSWESKGSRIPKRCPSCFSKKWDMECEVEEPIVIGNDTNKELKNTILDAYRKGMGCVEISISLAIPYSLVRNVITEFNPNAVLKA